MTEGSQQLHLPTAKSRTRAGWQRHSVSGLHSPTATSCRSIPRDALADAVAALDRLLARRSAHRGALVAADTNVYLHHPEPFERIDWSGLLPGLDHTGVHLLVPLVVVDELDRQKQGQSGKLVVRGGKELVRTRARTAIRTLEDLFTDPDTLSTVGPEPSPVRAELLVDPPGHVRLPSADAEIVDTARAAQDLARSTSCARAIDE